jgi:hypothetical protein
MMDYTWRLAGVCETPDALQWNVRPGHPAAESARFRMRTNEGRDAVMVYDRSGAALSLGGKELGRIDSGVARLITNKVGVAQALLGISEVPHKVMVRLTGQAARTVEVQPNRQAEL